MIAEELETLSKIIHSNKKEEPPEWRSCCLTVDKNAMVYLTQSLLSVMVLAFSASMLVYADGDCDKSSPYIGLISFILGKILSTVITGH